MPHASFVHLHVHTQYSLLDGACFISDLVSVARDQMMPALAITDHGNMFGAIEFYLEAISKGVKPIVGCEVYIAPGSRLEKLSRGIQEASFHFILLAKDEEGYKNLMKLVSIGYLEGFYYRPRIDKEILSQYSKGLIGLTSCLKGELANLILSGQTQMALDCADNFRAIFGNGNLYLELMDNFIPEQRKLNEELLKVSKLLSIPVVATNDVHYLSKESARAHEVLLCIQTQTTLSDPNRMKFQTDEFYFKTPEEMKRVFADIPEAISNTIQIAERCNLELDFRQVRLPHYEPPESKTREQFLRELCQKGLESRYGGKINEVILNRLEGELKVIESLGFTSYFLIVWDFVHYAKEKGIPVGPGRGCFLPNTKILMGDGRQIDIQNIKIKDYVISHTGRANKVKDLFTYDINEDIVNIKAKMPVFDLRLTADHKLLAIKHKMCNVKSIKPTICKPTCIRYCKNRLWKGYKLAWIKAAELSKNDFLAYPRLKIVSRKKPRVFDIAEMLPNEANLKCNNNSIWYEIGSNKIIQKRINRFIKLDKKIARLLGYYASEGWSRIKKREASIGFGFARDEEDKCIQVQELLKEIFDLDSKIVKSKKNGSQQVIGYSKIVAMFFERLCGKYAENKIVPQEIFNSSPEVKIEFITGLFLGDGSNKEKMRVAYDSVSYNLVSQIKMLLASLDIMSSIKLRSYNHPNWHESYKLTFSGRQLFYFNKIFKDFKANIRKQKFYRNDTFIDGDYIYFPIQRITFQKYKGKVYDISVEKDATYVANEISVHNSAAGSLTSYLLGITDIDPLRYGLLFERFLNPERVSLPDIDIDFCYERRGEVINYVTQKYSKERVAQIITFGTMQARAVIRDVGRVMGLSYAEVDKIAKLVPFDPNISLATAIDNEPELKNLYKSNPQVTQLIDTSLGLEGLSRHASTHAAGVVISEELLVNYIPLFKTSDDQITTGYPGSALEKIGLLKVDFLGLRTLTVIDETVKLLKKTQGVQIKIDQIPLDERKTFRLLSNAESLGVFQLESSGMRDLLRKLAPQRIEDIIALLALYRPGPIGSGMVDEFIKRKHGLISIKYDHKHLEPILKDTYGIVVYQEQVMRIASELAGFSLSQADILRRAMSKKTPEIMEEQRRFFVEGCGKNNIDQRTANKIFDLMEYFSGYGFNLSHSAAYALISYRTAYLKANYPLEYMSALLTSEKDNTDKIVDYINEAMRMGINILPPDINDSFAKFTPIGKNSIRFGLSAIKNVGTGAIESIIQARNKGGAFKSLYDFCERVDLRLVNRKVIESLIKCGAFDSFGLHRSQLMVMLEHALEVASGIQKDRLSKQLSFFDALEDVGGFKKSFQEIPNIKEWLESQMLAFEKEILGFYITGHPLARYEKILKTYASCPTAELVSRRDGEEILIGGIIHKAKQTTTRNKSEKMAILKLEDLDGAVEVLVFPEAFRQIGKQIRIGRVVFIKGKLNLRDEEPKVIANDIIPIEEVAEKYTSKVEIDLFTAGLEDQRLGELKSVLLHHPGKVPVYLNLTTPNNQRFRLLVGEELYIQPNEGLIQDLEKMLGERAVHLGTGTFDNSLKL